MLDEYDESDLELCIRKVDERMHLPPMPSHEDGDPRWQAIIAVGHHIPHATKTVSDRIWQEIKRWSHHDDDDFQCAIGVCLLEEFLGEFFEQYFDEVEELAVSDRGFGYTFAHCWKLGRSELPDNAKRFDALRAWLVIEKADADD